VGTLAACDGWPKVASAVVAPRCFCNFRLSSELASTPLSWCSQSTLRNRLEGVKKMAPSVEGAQRR
jgi:hypothetical protein